jgi:polyisoprenoid-binding protein YceI
MKSYVGLILGLSIVTGVQAADWTSEKAGSKLDFVAIYEKADAPGTFKDFSVKLTKFDPQKPAGAQLEVVVHTASADMNSKDMNEAIRESDWLDVAQFPDAIFTAKDIKPSGAGKYVANGKLKIKNVEKALSVPFTWGGKGKESTMQGELSLNRVQYNVGTGDWSNGNTIGLDVKVKFNVKLVQSK